MYNHVPAKYLNILQRIIDFWCLLIVLFVVCFMALLNRLNDISDKVYQRLDVIVLPNTGYISFVFETLSSEKRSVGPMLYS